MSYYQHVCFIFSQDVPEAFFLPKRAGHSTHRPLFLPTVPYYFCLEQTLPGMQLLSGGIKIEKPEEDLHGIYASSRIIVVAWSILFASFIISEDDGFDYRGALLAWVSDGYTDQLPWLTAVPYSYTRNLEMVIEMATGAFFSPA